MIDFHSHILPDIDDGSKNIKESQTMLGAMATQGVSAVVATPHFFADYETVDSFIERRDKAYDSLCENLFEGCPKIFPGAEIKYYNGISRLEDLKKLTIQTTKFLLIEMPFNRWTDYSIRELCEISNSGKYTVVLAHIDRYLNYQNRDVIERLLQNDILLQCNSSFFVSWFSSIKAFKMLKKMQIHFIGSDCHNTTSRPPNINKAFNAIAKKFGGEFVDNFINYSYELFLDNSY